MLVDGFIFVLFLVLHCFFLLLLVQKRSEVLACASGEQVEAVSNLGNKVISGSKGSSAPNSASIVYTDEFDTSVAILNIVCFYYVYEWMCWRLLKGNSSVLYFAWIDLLVLKLVLSRRLSGSIFTNMQRHYQFWGLCIKILNQLMRYDNYYLWFSFCCCNPVLNPFLYIICRQQHFIFASCC